MNVWSIDGLPSVHLNSRVTHKVRLLDPNMYYISINQDASLGTAEDIDGITILLSEEETSQSKNVDKRSQQIVHQKTHLLIFSALWKKLSLNIFKIYLKMHA